MHDAFEPFIEDYRAETANIHESCYVDTPCRIGEHTAILHFTHIMAHSIIGSFCWIGRNVTIASGVFLGDNVKVMNNAQLNSGVILENAVYCGPGAIFTENRRVRANNPNISRISPTLVRQGAQLGANTTIASGFTIGRHAFVEAGSVIDRNIPDFAIVYGNPLKFAGWRCECSQTIESEAPGSEGKKSANKIIEREIQCAYCGRQYLRQSQWKMIQLNSNVEPRSAAPNDNCHSDFEFDPSIRTAQGAD